MLDSPIVKVISLVMIVVWILKEFYDSWYYAHHVVPQQLIQLVKQAHLDQEERMLWDINVSDDMRMALCAPFTRQQLHDIKQAGNDIISYTVDGYVISSKQKAHQLSGVVCVSVVITSQSGKCNYKYLGTKLQITLDHIGTPGISSTWIISSVTQL